VFSAAAASGPAIRRSCPAPKGVIGTVGGENGALIVDDTSAHVHIGCTTATSTSSSSRCEGRFVVPGSKHHAHPVDRGIFHPAQFSAASVGTSMTLTIDSPTPRSRSPGAAQLRQGAAYGTVPDLPAWLSDGGSEMNRSVWLIAAAAARLAALGAGAAPTPPSSAAGT